MLVIIGLLLLFMITIPVISIYAQDNTTPTALQEGTPQNDILKEQVATTTAQTTLPVDTVTIGGIIATATGLYLNDRRSKKSLETKLTTKEEELKSKNQEIDEIIMDLEVINYKIFNSAYIYDDKTFRQILDLKSTNNPLEKNTLGEEYAIQINKLAKFTSVNYNIPMPNMSIPTTQVIQASSVFQNLKPVVKTPPPPHVMEAEVNPGAGASTPPATVDASSTVTNQ